MPIKWRSVDLPAPEGPMMETNSPSLISTLMRRRTNVLVGPCSKYFSILRNEIIVNFRPLAEYMIILQAGARNAKATFRGIIPCMWRSMAGVAAGLCLWGQQGIQYQKP